jgi:putative tryptophan/tyrosine transport system substrate-binding protein
MIRRREFITVLGGAAAAWPVAARAQQAGMPVVGILNSTTLEAQAERLAAFQQGLKETGFVAGENVSIDYRSAEGLTDQLPILARDLVRRQVQVLVATSTASALAAKRATTALPIVFLTGGDPIELGLVASLNRPGGNATGVSFLVNKLVAKRLELLSDLAPTAVTLGMLIDPNNPNAKADEKDAQAAAGALGRKLLVVKAASESELDAAFATLAEQQVANLFVSANVNFIAWRDRIMALAMRYAIAASYTTRDFVMAGGLMSYGPNQTPVFHQVGVYAGRILTGSRPADLPVMQSARFELVINLKTAKAQTIEIPPALLALADEVIE